MNIVRWCIRFLAGCLLAMPALSRDMSFLKASDFLERTYRGFTLDRASSKTAADFDALASIGVNLIRIGITLERCSACREYAIPASYLKDVDLVTDLAAVRGIYVILTLVPEPPAHAAYWEDAALQTSIINIWKQLASRYKGRASMGGFDLINEPNPPGKLQEMSRRYFEFAIRLIEAVRAIDPQRMIVFEPAPRGDSYYGFKALENPLPFDNVLYSAHFYEPVKITHQGVNGPLVKQHYPSEEWNKVRLSESMQPVRVFSRKYRLPIYFGEFSCVRFAPDGTAYRWIRDVAELIEAEGWSWTFHSFRGWHGWDQELPPSNVKPANPAAAVDLRSLRMPVMVLLRSHFEKNRRATD